MTGAMANAAVGLTSSRSRRGCADAPSAWGLSGTPPSGHRGVAPAVASPSGCEAPPLRARLVLWIGQATGASGAAARRPPGPSIRKTGAIQRGRSGARRPRRCRTLDALQAVIGSNGSRSRVNVAHKESDIVTGRTCRALQLRDGRARGRAAGPSIGLLLEKCVAIIKHEPQLGLRDARCPTRSSTATCSRRNGRESGPRRFTR